MVSSVFMRSRLMYSDYLNKAASCTDATLRVAALKTVGDCLLTGKSVKSWKEGTTESISASRASLEWRWGKHDNGFLARLTGKILIHNLSRAILTNVFMIIILFIFVNAVANHGNRERSETINEKQPTSHNHSLGYSEENINAVVRNHYVESNS